jgi:hypothetical protein
MVFRSEKNKVSFLELWHNRDAQGAAGEKDKTIARGGGGRGGERMDGTFFMLYKWKIGTHI